MSRKMKWLITGLCVSVALNLLTLGYVVARVAYHPAWTMHETMERLTPESRDVLKEAFESEKDTVKEKVMVLRDSHMQVVSLLGEDELDDMALEEAFSNLRLAGMDLQQTLQTAILEVAHELEPEERVKLVRGGQRMMRGMMMGPRRHHGGFGPHGPSGPPPFED